MDLSYEYTRKRVDFGRHPKFEDSEVVDVANIKSEPSNQNLIPRHHTTTEFTCTPAMSEHWVNTERFIQDDKGMSHSEGGWPKEVNTTEFSEKQRYVRKIETDATYTEQMYELAKRAEACVMQNNSIDVYEDYFLGIDVDHTGEPPSAKTITIFRDPQKESPRAVSKCNWHPDQHTKLAISYCTLQFQKADANVPVESYIWDIDNPNQPDFTIKPQSPLCTLVFNPKATEHLVGGSYNGMIGFWDLRKGSTPVEKSVIEQSHNDPVYDIYWIQSRTGSEFTSVSTDGYIFWWDTRKLGSGPMDKMKLQGEEGTCYGGTSLEYRTDAGATRFLVGTEQGTMMAVERKAKKDQESQKSIKSMYGVESGRHHGPVYSVERNPLFPKFILTVGDWACNIWNEDIKTPIMSSPYDPAYLTCGAWSPTRPGVFFTTKKDGVMDVWDYYFKQTEPVVAFKMGEQPLTTLGVQSLGRMIATGAQDGSCTVLQLCPSLAEPTSNEKPAITGMFDREMNREKNLQTRLLAQRRAQELKKKKGDQADKKPEIDQPEETAPAVLEDVDKKFFDMIEKNAPQKEAGNQADS